MKIKLRTFKHVLYWSPVDTYLCKYYADTFTHQGLLYDFSMSLADPTLYIFKDVY